MIHPRFALRCMTCALGATVVGLGSLSGPAGAASGVTANRLQGTNRYATAAAIASAAFPSGAKTAILASGANYPDALAGAYMAGGERAPLLLTDPNSLSSETSAALQKLGVTGVDIIGGTAAVSSAVQQQLQGAGYVVTRVSGADRYQTAADVAQSFPASFVGSYNSGGPTAVVATGLGFADALSASPMSYFGAYPILLTDPNSLSNAASSAITGLGIKQVIIVGGTAAVSSNVQQQLAGMNLKVVRIGGADRTDTAQQVASAELNSSLNFAGTEVNLARGDDFPDALSGGVYAGVVKEPIILTENPNALGQYSTTWLHTNAAGINTIVVFGGTAAISDPTVSAAQQAAT